MVAGEEFGGKVDVGFGSTGAWIVDGDGLTVTGSFGEANVARDGGGEEFVFEEVAEICRDLLRQVGAIVDHGEDDTFEAEGGVEGLGDAVEGTDELGDAFEGEVFGLHGDKEAVGGDERIEGEEIEGGGAIEQDEGVLRADGLDGVAKAELATVLGDELEISAY